MRGITGGMCFVVQRWEHCNITGEDERVEDLKSVCHISTKSH